MKGRIFMQTGVGGVLLACAAAAPAASITMVPATTDITPGDSVSIQIGMDFSGVDEATLGGGFDIFYDPTVLTFSSWVFDPALLAASDPAFTFAPNDCAAGLVAGCTQTGELNGITFGSFDGLTGPLPVGTVTFNVIDPSPLPGGSTQLTMQDNDVPSGLFISALNPPDPILVVYGGAELKVAGGPSLVPIVAAVLPASRSVQIGNPATAFATIINAGGESATACSIAPLTGVPADFDHQTTDPLTNALTGTPNTPVDIAAGASQSFLLVFTPSAEIAPTDVQLTFDCANSNPAPVTVGLNTLLLSASSTPVPDIVALAATPTGDGIVDVPGASGANAFAVASVNVGVGGNVMATLDTGAASLPLNLFICETDLQGACLSPPAASVMTTINALATPTFTIIVNGDGTVPFDPANNRIFVRFQDAGGVTRGSTSVAVQTVQ